MNLAADECGWRRYPAVEGVWRFVTLNPERYQEADAVEEMVNATLRTELRWRGIELGASGPDGARAAKS